MRYILVIVLYGTKLMGVLWVVIMLLLLGVFTSAPQLNNFS